MLLLPEELVKSHCNKNSAEQTQTRVGFPWRQLNCEVKQTFWIISYEKVDGDRGNFLYWVRNKQAQVVFGACLHSVFFIEALREIPQER